MNLIFAAFDSNGVIQFTMKCLEVGPSFSEDTGLSAVEVSDGVAGETHYIVEGAAQPKQIMSLVLPSSSIIANGTDEVIISGIPEGAQVEWPDGQTDIVTDGEIGFSVDLPGTYTFQFTAVPYLDQEVVIEAIAAT